MKKLWIILAIAVVLLAGAGIASYKLIKVEAIEIEGLVRQESSVVIDSIFADNKEKSVIKLLIDMKFKSKSRIPYVETYDIEFDGLNKIKVTVYEKSIVAYVKCMGTNWYFDKDGIVTESTDELIEGIPIITGFDYDFIIVDEKIPLENEKIFDILLELTQLINEYPIEVDRINIDKQQSIRLYMGNVRVELGDGANLNEKILYLNDIARTMEDVPGVLDMSHYDENNRGYTFKRD